MNAEKTLITDATVEKIAALIATLHQTERSLEELTAGEVDTVTDSEGRVLVLRRAQEQLRHYEAVKQAAILNALPAHIALIDTSGVIVSVNEAWQQFAETSRMLSPGPGIGVNYLKICERAQGESAVQAHEAAKGIRDVLDGKILSFSIEYLCHLNGEQHWFVLTATLLAEDGSRGAVVMHVDMTSIRHTEADLCARDSLFREMANNINDVFFVRESSGGKMLYISPAYEEIWGRTCESLYANPNSWTDSIHPDDQQPPKEQERRREQAQKFNLKYRILRPDGSIRWIEARGFPIPDDKGRVVRVVGVARDITEQKNAAHSLSESEQNLRSIFDGALDGILVADMKTGMLVSANPALCSMLGYTRQEITGIGIPEIVEGQDLPLVQEQTRQLMIGKIQMAEDVRLLRKNGSVVCTDIKGTAIVQDGKDCLLGVVRDITERKKTDDRIVYLNRIYAVLSGINSLIVRASDLDTMFGDACAVAVKEGGFRMALIAIVDEDTGNVVPVASAGNAGKLMDTMRSVLISATTQPNSMIAHAIREKQAVVSNDASTDPRVLFSAQYAEADVHSLAVIPLIIAGKVVALLGLFAGETGFFQEEEMKLLTGLGDDISFAIDHLEKNSRLNYLAYYDELTGLANRTLFLERLALHMRNAAAEGHKMALVLIDLERFRYINESLGRAAGDHLLKQVAQLLTFNVKDATCVGRVGADHFAIVYPDIKSQSAFFERVEKQTAAFMKHPFCFNDTIFRLAVKVGIAKFPEDGIKVETLLSNAEAALKAAKRSNKRYQFYTQSMNHTVSENLTLENRLREALDKEQFELYYQPKVSLATGKLTGVEALIRWHDPETGLVLPSRFIPILEETGLIEKVGNWALQKAVADYLRWRKAGLPAVRIAVNVSPMQLRNADFIDEIKQVLGIDEHAAGGLELEITESLIMENVKDSIESLKAIRAMNVSIAIDDFGTGFSSLSYLAKLPVDTLKIDRAFVIDMTTGPEGLALVSTIINLAHSMKLKVVAEGVETDEQARLLRLLGCEEIQGFLFSKPVPVDIFEQKFLASSTTFRW